MNNLFNYFKCESKDCRLPSPSGSLSRKVLSSMIRAVNDSISMKATEWSDGLSDGTKQEPYVKLSSEDKARIGNYAVTLGTSAAIRHFQSEFPLQNGRW